MKKLIVLILSFMLILGLGSQVAFAQPGNGNGNQNNGQQGQFSDTKGHWAETAIAKMQQYGFINGYNNGTFQPNKPVTEAEAIVMVVRAMDLEDDAQDADLSTLVDNLSNVPDWATGYLQVALDNEIITESELLSLHPNQGAKRIMVTLWLSRALDLDDYIDEDTELPFVDRDEISDELYDAAVLMYEAGLMKGDGHNFQPNKPITRAEMAILLDRIDESDAGDIYFTDFKGFITDVDDDYITVERWDISKTFEFADDVIVTLDGEDADIADLVEGLRVKLTLNSDSEVTVVKACTPDEDGYQDGVIDSSGQYIGRIVNIDVNDDDDDYISIKHGYHIYTFTVDEDTEITIDGEDADLTNLEIGWDAEIDADDGLATSIDVISDEEDDVDYLKYEGIIISLSDDQIVIEDVEGNYYTFDVDSDTEITLDGEDSDLSDLQVDDEVEIEADGDIAITIDAERNDD